MKNKIDKILSATDKNEIEAAVKLAEKNTNGEIVPIVAEHSDEYPGARWTLAFTFSLLITIPCSFIFRAWPLYEYVAVQLAALLLGFGVANISWLLRYFIPAAVAKEEVSQRAYALFLQHNVHRTPERNGIILYVSLLERRAEIIGDIGIHQKVGEDFWRQIISTLVADVPRRGLKTALTQAIDSCGQTLSTHFPKTASGQDDLPNKLIEA